MRFTIEPLPFLKLVEMVGEYELTRKQKDVTVRLVASQGRVWVEGPDRSAEMNAAVHENGQCELFQAKLLGALKICRDQSEIAVEADRHGLRIGGMLMVVISYCPHATPPGTVQIFLATDLGLVPSRFLSPLEPAAAA